MKRAGLWIAAGLATASLCACFAPAGPMVSVAPAPGKSFQAFAADQTACEQYADTQVMPQAAYATYRAIGTVLLPTALGAAIGAAVAGGHGAGLGAFAGAALGATVGMSRAGFAQMSVQQHYDLAYTECMSAHGNSAPGSGPPPDPNDGDISIWRRE